MIHRRPSIQIYFDTRRAKKSGKYPVKLRLTASWLSQKDKYFALGIDLTPDEWQQVDGKGRANDIAEIREELNRQLSDAHRIVDSLEYYTHGAFEDKFIRGVVDEIYVYDFFERKIRELLDNNQYSTATGYKSALAILKKCRNGRLIYFQDITVKFLQSFITCMENRDKSNATIRAYVRYFQHIYNIATEEGIVKADNSPFASSQITLPKGSRAKKALPDQIISALLKYKTDDPGKQLARDLWVFSFCIGGANFTDIARMTKANVHDDGLVYYRGKTAKRKNENEAIIAPLNASAKEIINRYAGGAYLFPILSEGISEKTAYNRAKDIRRNVNRWLEWIGRELNHPGITIGAARHSFATRMNRLGFDNNTIGKVMGHVEGSNLTEGYIRKEVGQYRSAFDKIIDIE